MKTVSSKFRWLFALCLGCAISAFGLKYTKSYSESFNVNNDVTIAVNTSYADVEFETWNKNEVEIDAYIEVEGVSEEEAEKYFKGWDFEALGNSGKVTVNAKSGPGFFSPRSGDFQFAPGEMDFDFKFEMPDLPEVPEIEELGEVEAIGPVVMELSDMPPMPPIPFEDFGNFSFDYEAYKRDGDEYLERWKKEFTENFEKNFKPKFEEWKKELEARKKDIERYKVRAEISREKMQEKMQQQKEKRERQMAKLRESARAAGEAARAAADQERKANVFYFKEGAKDRNVKVKKTIKIKMPKGARLKMDVRHGEVKLAENFKNIKATLSHTRLLASRVDGDQTYIEASYSPVTVDYWNKGKLKVSYVKDVSLKQVKSMDLLSTSSNVVIGTISNDALIKGSFGKLQIKNIADNFKTLDMVLDNTDAVIVLPGSAFNFYCDTSNSKVDFPAQLRIDIVKKYLGQLAKGYHKQRNSNKNINLTATYSDIVIR